MIPFELVSGNSILLQNRLYGLFILLLQPHFTMRHSGFLSFYNQNFEPKIDNSDCFFTKELGNIKTKNPDAVVELLPKYAGEYYLYYFSNHYENIIHSGKILIFLNSQQILARMIIGIQNDIPFKNKAFNNIFDKDISNDYAYTL